MEWPPTLEQLKSDAGLDDDLADDELITNLSAAVAFVQRVRAGEIDFEDDLTSDLPAPDADLHLGTIRLARRWFTRRQSPAALVELAELGSARVPSFDPDIDRMLRVGPYTPTRFA